MGTKYYKHKTFDQDVNTMLDYIRSFKDGVVASIDTVKEKTGINEVYACNVLRVVRETPGMETKKCESNKRTTIYTYKEPVEEPAEESKMHKKYKNLTEDQVEYIHSVLAAKPVVQNLDTVMTIMNVLASLGAVSDYVDKYVIKLADLLVLKHAQIRLYIGMLRDLDLVSANDNQIKLILSKHQDIQPEIKAQPIEDVIETSPAEVKIAEEVKETITPEVTAESVIESDVNTSVPEKQTTPNHEVDLISNMESFTGVIGQFQTFMGNMVQQIKNSTKLEIDTLNSLLGEQDKEIACHQNEISNLKIVVDEYKSQFDESNTALKKIINENTTLRENLAKRTEDLRLEKKFSAAQKTLNDNIFAAMQERFEVLLADINNTISDYTRISAWQLTSNDSARVQKQVIDAVTSAMNDLLNQNHYKTDNIE